MTRTSSTDSTGSTGSSRGVGVGSTANGTSTSTSASARSSVDLADTSAPILFKTFAQRKSAAAATASLTPSLTVDGLLDALTTQQQVLYATC